MQFSPITAILRFVGNAAVIDNPPLAVAQVEERSTQQSIILSTLDIFTNADCSNYHDTIFTTGFPDGFNGRCFVFDPPVPSVKATLLHGTCTLTVYNDAVCNHGGTSAWAGPAGKCVPGLWKSFSTDSCNRTADPALN